MENRKLSWFAQDINFFEQPEVINLRSTRVVDYSRIIHIYLFLKAEAIRQINLVGYKGEDQEFKVLISRINYICGGTKEKLIKLLPNLSDLYLKYTLSIDEVYLNYLFKKSHINKAFFNNFEHTSTLNNSQGIKDVFNDLNTKGKPFVEEENRKEKLEEKLEEFLIPKECIIKDQGGNNIYKIKKNNLLERHLNLRIAKDGTLYCLDDIDNKNIKNVLSDLFKMFQDIRKDLFISSLKKVTSYLKSDIKTRITFISIVNMLNRSNFRGTNE